MKCYIATGLERIEAHNIVRDALNEFGHEITYDWTIHGSVQNISINRLQEVGHLEQNAVKNADFVVVLLPGGNGTHTELGLSIAYNKPIFLHALDSKFFNLGSYTCAFYHLSHVKQLRCPSKDIAKCVHKELETMAVLSKI